MTKDLSPKQVKFKKSNGPVVSWGFYILKMYCLSVKIWIVLWDGSDE